MKPRTTPDGLWEACNQMERSASFILAQQLSPFDVPIRKCYEAGVQASILPSPRHGTVNILFSALFLKKALNDLRSCWILLMYGYTSQAASVAASLFENALAVNCLAGSPSSAQRFRDHKTGDLPWAPKRLSKILANRWKVEARESQRAFTQDDYENAWQNVYAQYKWLCKIKHPTFQSALHDSSATSLDTGEYVVMAAPDIRDEDLPVKATVISIAISRVREAIRSFAIALECDKSSPAYLAFVARMEEALSRTNEAYEATKSGPLPFHLER